MRCRHPWLPGLLLVVSACQSPLSPPLFDDEGDPAEQVVAGSLLRERFTAADGYLLSPVLEVPEGATRVALMLDLNDDGEGVPLEAAAVDAEAVPPRWIAAQETWREGARRVARAELGTTSWRVQLRLPASQASRLALLVWSALIPPERPTTGSAQVPRTQPTTQRQALVAGVIPRAGWGARAPSCVTPESFFNRMTVHHTVTAPSINGDYAARLREIQAYHMDGRGYCDIAYNYLVTTDGRTWEGRGTNRGGHVLNENAGNIGVSFIGCFHSSDCAGLDPNMPPAAMIAGGAALVAGLAAQHGIAISGSTVLGHRDIGQTACPGDYLYDRLGELRAGGGVDDGGCTPTQRANCGAYGCGCADGQCSGGFCPGTGCSAQQVQNCGAFGCNCVDGQCNGGYCPGTGCTAKETLDCGNYGCGCVDHACNGVFCEGSGCTARETLTCTEQAQDCKDHQCRASAPACDPAACAGYGVICCPGVEGCVNQWVDNLNCGACGVACAVDESCEQARCAGADGCSADERAACAAAGASCSAAACVVAPVVDPGETVAQPPAGEPPSDGGNADDPALPSPVALPRLDPSPEHKPLTPAAPLRQGARDPEGCGCRAGASPGTAAWVALALLGAQRRRRPRRW